jgi:lipopolysaccharide exporter
MQTPSSSSTLSRFSHNVITLAGGTAFAQILTILAAPILTRLYGPEAFGLLALFISITGVIIVISCLRYEFSIMLPESDEDAINLLGLCILIVTIITVLSIPVIWAGGNFFSQLLNAPDLEPYLWFVPPVIFIGGVFLALNYWNSRKNKFGRLSIARVTSSVTTTGTQISSGFLGYNGGGNLIIAYFLGQFISTVILTVHLWRDNYHLIKKSINFYDMKRVFGRYKKFPQIDTISSLLNNLSWQMPVFLLAAFFSPIIVGFYALGFRILQVPMKFVGDSTAQVFFQQAAEAKRDKTLPLLVENIFKILIVIGLFPILVLTFIGKDVFSVVFGQIWAEAGVYSQILSIWALIWFITSPLSTLYIVLEKQEFGLIFNFANFVSRVVSLVIGGMLGSPILALILFAVSGIFVYGYLGFKMLEYSQVERSHSKKIIITSLIKFIPAGFLLLMMILLGASSILLVITGILLCVIYYSYIIKTDSQIQSLFFSIPSIQKFLKIFKN